MWVFQVTNQIRHYQCHEWCMLLLQATCHKYNNDQSVFPCRSSKCKWAKWYVAFIFSWDTPMRGTNHLFCVTFLVFFLWLTKNILQLFVFCWRHPYSLLPDVCHDMACGFHADPVAWSAAKLKEAEGTKFTETAPGLCSSLSYFNEENSIFEKTIQCRCASRSSGRHIGGVWICHSDLQMSPKQQLGPRVGFNILQMQRIKMEE